MDTSKEEIVNLRKQINRLKISLMFTQVLMIALLLILGYQCLWSIWNYHYLLQQISMCLDSVNTVYSDNCKSGATEKNREKSGSVSISRINITAELNVLKFFRAISRRIVT